jgi:hypothetical protein
MLVMPGSERQRVGTYPAGPDSAVLATSRPRYAPRRTADCSSAPAGVDEGVEGVDAASCWLAFLRATAISAAHSSSSGREICREAGPSCWPEAAAASILGHTTSATT